MSPWLGLVLAAHQQFRLRGGDRVALLQGVFTAEIAT